MGAAKRGELALAKGSCPGKVPQNRLPGGVSCFRPISLFSWISRGSIGFHLIGLGWDAALGKDVKGFVVSIHLLKLYSSFPESALFISRGLRSAIALTSDCAATKFGRQSKDKWAPFSFLGPIKAIPGQLWDYYGRAAQITTILGLSLGIVLQCCTIFYFKFSLGIAQFRFPSLARDTPAFFNLLATLVKIRRDKGWKLKKDKDCYLPTLKYR